VPAYVIADAKVHDERAYGEAAKAAPGVLAENGGHFLARGDDAITLEGAWVPSRLLVIEFPDMNAVHAWYQSPIYQQAKALRAGAADMNIVAIAGT
jgi:uncharacterized protein (DUF1330 family)